MLPAAKFYALVTAATIAVMFVALTWIVPAVQSLTSFPAVASGIAGVLVSVGVYRLISLGAEAVIHRFARLCTKILNAEGVR